MPASAKRFQKIIAKVISFRYAYSYGAHKEKSPDSKGYDKARFWAFAF
jgi:hypothetical protein